MKSTKLDRCLLALAVSLSAAVPLYLRYQDLRVQRLIVGKWSSVNDRSIFEFDAQAVAITNLAGTNRYPYSMIGGRRVQLSGLENGGSTLGTVSIDATGDKAVISSSGLGFVPNSKTMSIELTRVR